MGQKAPADAWTSGQFDQKPSELAGRKSKSLSNYFCKISLPLRVIRNL